MNQTAIAYAIQLMAALPSLIQAGIDVAATVNRGKEKLEQLAAEDRNPSDEEWADLNAQIDRLRGELHAP